MGAAEDVDRVQLQQADVVDRTPQVADADPAVRPRSADALRGECDAARLRRAQLDLGVGVHRLHDGVSRGVTTTLVDGGKESAHGISDPEPGARASVAWRQKQ